MIKEIIFFILPLTLSGIIHHAFIINKDFFSSLKIPVDFGVTINHRRLFGDSKTWRGFFVVVILTAFFSFFINNYTNIFNQATSFFIGALLGLGYSLGELPNSFLKRQLNIKSSGKARGRKGRIFNFLDHTDSIIGSLLVVAIIYSKEPFLLFVLFIIGSGLHLFGDTILRKYSYKKQLKQ